MGVEKDERSFSRLLSPLGNLKVPRCRYSKDSGDTQKRPMGDTKNPANENDTSLRPIIANYSSLENASRLPFGLLTAAALTRSPARSWILDTGEGKRRKSPLDESLLDSDGNIIFIAVPLAGFLVSPIGRIAGVP